MEENIEVKDVQRTEYLDKNGLDMLWAKVKENTHNQVEVERNRAVAKENSIIDTKADKSALDDYALNTTLTALEQKVTANTTAIEGKQDAGNYIPYKEIEGGLTYYLQDSYNIMCQKGFSASSSNYDYAAINYNCVKVAKGINNYILIDKDNIEIKDGDYAMALISANSIFSRNRNNDFNFQLTSSGIQLLGGDNNHVLTSNASTIDITEYAKKTDIPEVSTSDFISKTATNITTGGFGQIRTVDTINNNIGVGNNTSSLAYIGEGELGVIGYRDGYATESFRYTNTYGLETTNTSGYKNVKIPCDSNKVSIYKGNSNNYCTDYRYSGVVLGENNDNNNLLNTNGGYKTIGTDIAPLENSKVPTAYLTAATKEELGVVKVGDGLNVTDGTISVDSTAIGAGNYIPYESIDNHGLYKTYITKHNEGILFDSGSGNISISGGEIMIKNAGSKLALTSSFIWLEEISDNGNRETLLAELTERGVRLRGGDNNHVLTSYGTTIDIRKYALKSVYDKKIAALEARIAALEAKHAETA